MTTRVRQWGNSLALRIPKSFAKDIHLSKGSKVNIFVNDGLLIIDPSPRPKYSLSSLVGKIKKSNLYAEINPGLRRGNEAW